MFDCVFYIQLNKEYNYKYQSVDLFKMLKSKRKLKWNKSFLGKLSFVIQNVPEWGGWLELVML